jgi:asparagine synthase (glutamine-hydrolysing)
MSMCHSLEVRVPFLDHILFEFSATIPSEMKIKWFRKKHLLKKGLSGLLPGPILMHKKQGFVGPMSQWLKSELKDFTLDTLSRKNLDRHGIFDEPTVRRVLADHFNGKETNDSLIWALIVFQVWYDLYIENGRLLLSGIPTVDENRHLQDYASTRPARRFSYSASTRLFLSDVLRISFLSLPP